MIIIVLVLVVVVVVSIVYLRGFVPKSKVPTPQRDILSLPIGSYACMYRCGYGYRLRVRRSQTRTVDVSRCACMITWHSEAPLHTRLPTEDMIS